MVIRKTIQNCFALTAAMAVALQPVFAQGIVGDGSPTAPEITTTPNDIPLIMIETPNGQGLSHNTFTSFDVSTDGAILNNGNENYVFTELAGWVPGNGNLSNGAASVIIAEVTGINPTQMLGYVEVAGVAADVVVANPYGITCNGCGFINTDRAVLTTGTPEFSSGNLQSFSVETGLITIGEMGADASGVSQFDLIARQVQFAGSVHGERVRVIAGRNDVIYATGDATAKADDGSAPPSLAIDSTVLGGMYANKITIISTEDGAGVRAPQNMSASSGGMSITADGRLIIGDAQSGGPTHLQSNTDDVQVEEQIVSDGPLSIEAAKAVMLEADGVIVSQASADIRAGTDVEIGQDATLASAGDMALTAADLDVVSGATLQGANLTLTISNDASIAGELYTAGQASIHAGAVSVSANGGRIAGVSGVDITTTSGTVDVSGIIESAGAVSVRSAADIIQTTTSGIRSTTNGVSLTATGTVNLAGMLQSATTLTVDAQSVHTAGNVLAGTSVAITSQTGDIVNSGVLQTNLMVATAATDFTNTGDITANLGVTATDQFHNAGIIKGTQIHVQSDGFSNASGANILSNASQRFEIAGDFSNDGVLLSGTQTIISAGGDLTNTGTIDAYGVLNISATSLSNTANGVLEAGGAGLATGDGLVLSLSEDLDNAGTILSQAVLNITADQTLTNTGVIEGHGTTSLTATTLRNSGQITAADAALVLTPLTTFDNTGGTIRSDIGLALITSSDLVIGDANWGTVESGGYISITGANGGNTGHVTVASDGELVATSTLMINAASITNHGTLASATGNVLLTAQSDLENTGLIYAGGDALILRANGDITNSGILLAQNNMIICGANSEDCLTDLAADRATSLTNTNGGVIETINGDLIIAANDISNHRDAPIANTTTTGPSKVGGVRRVGSCSGTKQYCHLYQKYQIVTTTTVTESVFAGAEIRSGSNLVLSADDILNSYSHITAIDNITFDANTVTNLGLVVEPDYTYSYDRYSVYIDTSVFGGGDTYYRGIVNEQTVYHGEATVYSGSIQAGGAITGTITGYLDNLVVQENTAPATSTVVAPNLDTDVSITQTAGAGFTQTNVNVTPAGISIGNAGTDTSTMLNGQLFTTNPDPSSNYLIETRHDFINLDNFLSSDYFLDGLGFDPELTEITLGDPFVETQIIRNQIIDQTGNGSVDTGVSEYEQIQSMYDNAIDAFENLDLSVGVSLTPDQIDSLTNDIIWLEEQEINGVTALVPVVYIAGGADNPGEFSGAEIVAANISIHVGDLNNEGAISADDNLVITAANDIVNLGGNINAGGDLTLASFGGDVINTSGTITGENITLSGTNVISQTDVTRFDNDFGFEDVLSTPATITATGDLNITALDNVTFTGASTQAGGNTTISGGGDITFGAVDVQSVFETSADGYAFEQETSHATVSTITTGGDLTVFSGQFDDTGNPIGGGNIIFEGTQIAGGGAIDITAMAGSVAIGGAENIDYTYDFYQSDGLLSSTTTTSESLDVTYTTTTFQGGDVNINAGSNIINQSADFEGDTLAMTAGGDITNDSLTDIHLDYFFEETEILGGLLGSSTETSLLDTYGQSTQADLTGDLNFTAGNNLTFVGGDYNVDGTFTTDVNGQTSILAIVDNSYNETITHENNGITITDTTDVTLTQTASFTAITAEGGVNFDTDSETTIGLNTTQAAIGTSAQTLTGGVTGTDAGTSMTAVDFFLPSANGPPLPEGFDSDDLFTQIAFMPGTIGLGLENLETDDTPSTPSNQPTDQSTDPSHDYSNSTTTIGLPTATDGTEFAYFDTLITNDNVTVETMDIINHHFHESTTALNPAFQVLLSAVIMPYVLGANGLGVLYTAQGGASLTVMQTAFNAGVSSLATGVVSGAITGDMDLGEILEGAALSALAAGLSTAITNELTGTAMVDVDGNVIKIDGQIQYTDSLLGDTVRGFSDTSLIGLDDGILSLQSMANGVIDSTVSAGVDALVYDVDFGDAFHNNIQNFGLSQVLAGAQNFIGDLTTHEVNGEVQIGILGEEGSLAHAFAHGIVGCGFTEASGGNCAAGFAAGVGQSLYAGALEGAGPVSNADQQATAQMIGASLGYLFSGGEGVNVSTAGTVSQSGITWNRQLHLTEVETLLNLLAEDLPEDILALLADQDAATLDAYIYSPEFFDRLNPDQQRLLAASCAKIHCNYQHFNGERRNLSDDPSFRDQLAAFGSGMQAEYEVLSATQMFGYTQQDLYSDYNQAYDTELTADTAAMMAIQTLEGVGDTVMWLPNYLGGDEQERDRMIDEAISSMVMTLDEAEQLREYNASIDAFLDDIYAGGYASPQDAFEAFRYSHQTGVMTEMAIAGTLAPISGIRFGGKPDGGGNGADDVVYRGDTRGPDEIFEEGFQPRNPGSDTSLEDYVDYNAPSDYVGTTTNRPNGDSSIEGSPESFGTNHGDQDGFVYEIDQPSNGVDVNSQYPDGPFPNENEIAVPGGVDPSCIRGCTPVAPDGTPSGDFIPNPNYTGGE